MLLGKMKLLIKLACFFATFLLWGCSTHSNNEYGPISSGDSAASYVQWNENYAVTVKHIKQLDSYVYLSGKYDIQFFEKKSTKIPKWRSLKSKESLTMSGFYNGEHISLEGHDMGINVKPNSTPIPVYRVVDVAIKPGMSGGPVTGDDGAVVGMNIGFSKESLNFGERSYKISVYIPYEIILKEWINYQKILDEDD